MAILVENLKQSVVDTSKISDKVVIISGYFSPDVIDEIAKLNVPFTFYYGMYAIDKITEPIHNKLKLIVAANSNLTLKFVDSQRVHIKCYLFYKKGNIFNSLVGSANCSSQGLCSSKNAEMLVELNDGVLQPNDYLQKLEAYSNEIDDIAIDINSPLIKPRKANKVTTSRGKSKKSKVPTSSDPLVAIMPLYKVDKRGRKATFRGGGPNWGNANNHHAKVQKAMESYVPIWSEHLDKYPLHFPPFPVARTTTGGKVTRRSDPITVIWDDGEMMTMTFQGSQREYPNKKTPLMAYPKQLSYGDDSTKRGGTILGQYLRKRMNVDPFHVITISDLKKYGRDYIELTYVSSGLYQADFSGTPLP